jgi:hypothetical protein
MKYNRPPLFILVAACEGHPKIDPFKEAVLFLEHVAVTFKGQT